MLSKRQATVKTLCADLGGSRVKLAAVEDGRVLDSEMFPVGGDTAEVAHRARRTQ